MKGGETMKKLNKRNDSASNTIEAYSCYCSCSCYCGCNCFCFLGIGKEDNDTGSWYSARESAGDNSWSSVGYSLLDIP
jgi:putative bacteriocin precursor